MSPAVGIEGRYEHTAGLCLCIALCIAPIEVGFELSA